VTYKKKVKADKSNDTFNNDNTSKMLGFDYQKLIALEMCLDGKPNQHIWIECKGDIADENVSIEVKHHIDKHNLTSNSEDAWKTIKNYVDNYLVAKTFDSLVLHTTSSIKSDSIFFEWNSLNASDKFERLVNHNPSDSIKSFYDKIKSCAKSEVLIILKKSLIFSDQLKVDEKWNQLRSHPTFILIPESYRDNAIMQLHGYITKAAIDNANMWQININDFHRDMQHSISKFLSDKIQFVFISNDDIDSNYEGINFYFVQKMKDVNLKERDQQQAVSEYLRAQKSQIELLNQSPVLIDNLKAYDNNVETLLHDEKSQHSYSLSSEELDTDKADNESREVYFNCRKRPHETIASVQNTEKYYRDGRIHHLLEVTNFQWKYEISDL